MKLIPRINKYPKSNKTIKAQERSHSSDELKLHYPSTRKISLVLHREKRKIRSRVSFSPIQKSPPFTIDSSLNTLSLFSFRVLFKIKY